MRIQEKTVYYCEFCNKHGLSKSAMIKHETYCTGNINRKCRWGYYDGNNYGHKLKTSLPDLANEIKSVITIDDSIIEYIRDVVDGCPACTMTILRNSGKPPLEWGNFDYKETVDKFKEKQESQLW